MLTIIAYALIAILGAICLPHDNPYPLSARLLVWALWPVVLVFAIIHAVLDWWECEVAWRWKR